MNNPKNRTNTLDVVYDYIELIGVELVKRFGSNPTPKDIVRHMSEKGMIEPKRIRDYMVIADFDKLLSSNEGNRTHTFMDLSIKYELTERQCQNIVYRKRKVSSAAYNISY